MFECVRSVSIFSAFGHLVIYKIWPVLRIGRLIFAKDRPGHEPSDPCDAHHAIVPLLCLPSLQHAPSCKPSCNTTHVANLVETRPMLQKHLQRVPMTPIASTSGESPLAARPYCKHLRRVSLVARPLLQSTSGKTPTRYIIHVAVSGVLHNISSNGSERHLQRGGASHNLGSRLRKMSPTIG